MTGPLIPDLLHQEPRARLDMRGLAQALTFAFASGGTAESFDKLFARASEESDFAPDCFAKELFLKELVARCMQPELGHEKFPLHRAHLVSVLSRPPRDLASITFRHGILRELEAAPELCKRLERLAQKLRLLQLKLEAPDRGKRYDAIGRRLDILRDIRDLIDELATSFASAGSGLLRLHAFGKEQRASESYENLVNLLDHEGNRALVELRVRVGYDGEMRAFEIVRASEHASNPFYRTPLGRFLTKLRLWLSGYGFREAELVGRLINSVFDGVQSTVTTLFQLLADIEFYLGNLALRALARSRGLDVCLPVLSAAPNADSELSDLYNPFLLLEERAPKPAQIRASRQAMVIITGPNSGGKTRLLQALGLAQLLAQAGCYVPARSARLPLRHGLFVSLSQEPSAEAREGRLGTELIRIRTMFEQLSPDSLVILDELCSGTNPSEGEEIFELVVGLLAELEPQAFITTHFLQFAKRLEAERPAPRLEFLQVELDTDHQPTYGFVPGVATTSLAQRTAERLGVTREALHDLVLRAKKGQRSSTPVE
ncbi:MAG TPA: DNA mismatch repair protein [Polyangiaceae bacterium]